MFVCVCVCLCVHVCMFLGHRFDLFAGQSDYNAVHLLHNLHNL